MDNSDTPKTEQIKKKVAQVAEDARDSLETKARTEAENARNKAAAEAQKAANAASAAANEFDPNSLQARAIEQVAMRIEELASDIRGADIDRMARTVRSAAERNPVLFVAGAALAGFALTRFLSARSPSSYDRYGARPSYDPWDTGAASYRDRAEPYDLSSRGGV